MLQSLPQARAWRWSRLEVRAERLDAFAIGALSLLAALVFWQFDLVNRVLPVDLSMMIYVGQQILRGQPPYLTVGIVKTPLAGFASAGAILIGRALGLDDVHAVRVLFFLVAISTVVLLYLIGRDLLKSRA